MMNVTSTPIIFWAYDIHDDRVNLDLQGEANVCILIITNKTNMLP